MPYWDLCLLILQLRKDFTNTNIMVEPVGKVLKSVAPATALSTNRELDYGHIAGKCIFLAHLSMKCSR